MTALLFLIGLFALLRGIHGYKDSEVAWIVDDPSWESWHPTWYKALAVFGALLLCIPIVYVAIRPYILHAILNVNW